MKKFIAGVIALSLVCGMSACGSSDSSSSNETTAATTTTTATSEETTITTTTTEKEMTLLEEISLDDGTTYETYKSNDSYIVQVLFSKDDPYNNLVTYGVSIEDKFSSDIPNDINSIVFVCSYNDEMVFNVTFDRQSDGGFTTENGYIWFDSRYEDAYNEIWSDTDTSDTDNTNDYTLLNQSTLDDGTEVTAYTKDVDSVMIHFNFSKDEPLNNIVTFGSYGASLEEELPNEIQNISYWGFYGEDMLFSASYTKQSDGTFSSPMGIIWFNEDYEQAYNEIINNQ